MKTPAEIAAEVVGIYEDRRHRKGRTLTGRVTDALAIERAKADALAGALKGATASLVAATSLLRNGGKKAAPSDKMFAIMLDDYERAIAIARAAWAAYESDA